MSTDRLGVAEVLERIADHLELKGENPFRIRAFRTAAKAILELPRPVEEALSDGSLAAARGIGPATLAIVREFLETGHSGFLDELRQEIPQGLLEMLAVPGLGMTRVRTLHRQLGVTTLAELEAAARGGTLATLAGFGPKTAAKVLRGIGFVRGKEAHRLAHHAAREAEVLRSSLAGVPGVRRVEVAGAVRRRCPVVAELGFAVEVSAETATLLDRLREVPGIRDLRPEGPAQVSFAVPGGVRVRVQFAEAADFGIAFIQATGSESHLGLLAEEAARRGLELRNGRVWRGGNPLATPTEADGYRTLGLAEIPPELREGVDEVALARAGSLPRLVERSDLRGLLHCHSVWSDGTTGIAELAAAGREAGYEYLGLSDHSQAAAYAGGLRPEDLERQWEEIDRVNAAGAGCRVLKGIEADILGDGRLDYDDPTLARFEFVIGSVHSRLGMSGPEMTGRLLRALDHPALTILGHPTGRLLLSREPSGFEIERVFARAAERGVALEINGDPHRLDLDWRSARRARDHGVRIALGADAHGIAGIGNLEYAVWMARKAGLTAGDVVNTGTADRFLDFARSKPA